MGKSKMTVAQGGPLQLWQGEEEGKETRDVAVLHPEPDLLVTLTLTLDASEVEVRAFDSDANFLGTVALAKNAHGVVDAWIRQLPEFAQMAARLRKDGALCR